MRIKTILVAIFVPAAIVLAGLGTPSSASATKVVKLPPPGSTCETVLCSAGSICIDTKEGPRCILDPNGPSDS